MKIILWYIPYLPINVSIVDMTPLVVICTIINWRTIIQKYLNIRWVDFYVQIQDIDRWINLLNFSLLSNICIRFYRKIKRIWEKNIKKKQEGLHKDMKIYN